MSNVNTKLKDIFENGRQVAIAECEYFFAVQKKYMEQYGDTVMKPGDFVTDLNTAFTKWINR
jgi:hypothetical protein